MSINACFVANFGKTYFFHEIAQQLVQNNVNIYWVVVNQKLYDFLLTHYPASHILYISKKNARIPAPKKGEFKINELVYGDRVLSKEPSWGFDFLKNIQEPIFNFIHQQQIRFIFGELTWAHEILIHRMVRYFSALQCQYLCPEVVRMPDGRFAFFQDEFQSKILDVELKSREVQLTQQTITLEKSQYIFLLDKLVKNSMSLKARMNRLKRFFTMENIDKFDPNVFYNRWLSLKRGVKEEVNKELYKFVKKISYAHLAGKKYVFVALHKQPEATIDAMGRYYEDQFQNIVNIWRILPDDWYLVVKEHTNAIGDRGPSFFKKVTRLRNAFIIEEKTDSHLLIKNCEFVVTVTGTVAYEAALMGKPAVTFASVFFNTFAPCINISINQLKRCSNVYDLLQQPNLEAVEKPAEYILKNSFEGLISDPISDPKCMSPENIHKVSRAFLTVTSV